MISDIFLQNTKNLPPNRILQEALPYVKDFKHALDLGCGAFRDTHFMLEKGFNVDAIDNSLNVSWTEPDNQKMRFYSQSFSEFSYEKDKYDLVNAQYSIPFCNPDDFKRVWSNVTHTLKVGGIFAGQLFGTEDGFSPDNNMTFLSREEVAALFDNFKIHTFVEAKRTAKTATGREKFWHVFDVIAEKLG
jgi:SAM-dependent methyltransferase